MLLTLVLLAALLVPLVMSVACVMIARHLYPRGQRLTAGLGGVVGTIGLPVLVILGIRDAPHGVHEALSGNPGAVVSLVLFAGTSMIAPALMLWFHSRNGKIR
jgi:hypothetical protein